MNSGTLNHSRRFHTIEVLEGRLLLDGDVSTLVKAGDLIVKGDRQGNHVILSQPQAGTIRVTGLDGTTVNGQPSVDVTAVTRDVMILMQQGGEDQVAVQGPFDVPRDLQLRVSHGDVAVEGSAGAVTIGRTLNARGGKDSTVSIRNEVRISGAVSIKTGADVNVASGLATIPDFAAARFDDPLTIDNPYFPLVPGTMYNYESQFTDPDTGKAITETTITEVTADTRTIAGVVTRNVHDRVFDNGIQIEDTFDRFAQDNDGNVWYFGEDTTAFQLDDKGNVIGQDKTGSWEAGVNGAQAGVNMEAQPRIGHRYQQEFAPGAVMDQGEGLAIDETTTVPAGTFTNVLRTKDTSVLEPGSPENKLYAPGLGTIEEFDLDAASGQVIQDTRLTSVTLNSQTVTQVVSPTGFTGTNADGRAIGGVQVTGAAKIRTSGPVIFIAAQIGLPIDVRTKDDVVLDSVIDHDASISTHGALSFRSVQAAGAISAGGNANVFVSSSTVGTLRLRLGSAANDLAVKGSHLDVLDANGGAGRNTLEDQGDNVIGVLKLKRFTHA